MSGKFAYALIGILLLGWVGAVAMSAIANWPHLPLDMPAKDTAVAAAYQKAVSAHVMRAAIAALAPVVVIALGVLLLRRRGDR